MKATSSPDKPLTGTKKALYLTAVFLATAAVPGVNGMPARATIDVAEEAPGMLYMMHKDEVVYLSQPRLADPRTNTWTITGRLPEEDGGKKILFTVKSTPLTQAWSLATRHEGFNPARIAGKISPAEARYHTTYHKTTFSFLQGTETAELLSATPMPPEPPPPAKRSGIPFALPGSAFSAAFSPF